MHDIEVQRMRAMCVGTKPDDWRQVLAFAQKHPEHIFCALALYPTEMKSSEESRFVIQELRSFIEKNLDWVKAIGETGLEYFHEKDEAKRALQKQLFVEHINLAKEFNKPLIIHARESYQDTYDILQQHTGERFVMHSFLGSVAFLQKFISLGGYISFNSIVLLTDQYDELIGQTPHERLFVETDSPFIRNNTPLAVRVVVEKIAKIKAMQYDEIERITYANANAFFGLDQ